MKNFLDKFKLKNKKSVILGGLGLLGSSITGHLRNGKELRLFPT